MNCTYTALFLCSDIKHFTIQCRINTHIHTLMVGAAKQGTNLPIRSNSGISIMPKNTLSCGLKQVRIKRPIFRLANNMISILSHSWIPERWFESVVLANTFLSSLRAAASNSTTLLSVLSSAHICKKQKGIKLNGNVLNEQNVEATYSNGSFPCRCLVPHNEWPC